MKNRLVQITTGGLLLALGVALPVGFHYFGNQLGRVFLPMHICIFLGGMLIGPVFGAGMGVMVPVISFLISGMPTIPILFFMMAELFLYGLIAGIAYKFFNSFISLMISQLAGRIIFGLALFVTGNLLGLPVPAADSVIASFVTGLPGIIIQLIIIPAVVAILKRGGFLNEKSSGPKKSA